MEKNNTTLRVSETQTNEFSHLINPCVTILSQQIIDGFETPEMEEDFYKMVLPLYMFLDSFIQRKARESGQFWLLAQSAMLGMETDVTWTGSKAEAVELMYALKHAGVLNNGEVPTKRVIEWFEITFRIDLGNSSKVFQEIRNRKKSIASLIGKMDKALARYVDQLDEEESKTGFLKRA